MRNLLRNVKLFTLSLLLIATPSILYGQKGDIERELDALFAQFDKEVPGLSVAISLEGEIIYNKAFGMANMEWGVPNQTNTIYEIGSVSKQFLAAAILLLAKEGKLSLQDDVRKWVPELRDYGTIITVDMLIAHTSGVKNWGTLYSYHGWPFSTQVFTQELGWDITFKQRTLNFEPGTKYTYSNSNYLLLALIVERVTGMTLSQYSDRYIFRPLGMNDTKWRDDFREILPRRATAYTERGGAVELHMPFEDLHGAGGLLSTTADLLKWQELYLDNSFFGEHFSQNRIEERLLSDGTPMGYAAGLRVGYHNGFKQIYHSGSTAGYKSWLTWFPEKRLSVVLLSNSGNFVSTDFGAKVADIVLQGERGDGPKKVAEIDRDRVAPLSDYIGEYYSADVEAKYKLYIKDGKLRAEIKAGDTIRLRATKLDHFTSSKGDIQFERDTEGRVSRFKISKTRAINVPFERISDN